MRIVHRIAMWSTPAIRAELRSLGIDIEDGFVGFDVDESSPAWPIIQSRLAQWDAGDMVHTEFSSAELNRARWIVVWPTWHHGYPQPNEDESGYLDATYDLADYCRICGIGLKQKAPFQMRGEPKWGRRSILQLNWVFDEYFVQPLLYEEVFKPRGIDARPVLHARTLRELQTVVQLVIPMLTFDIDSEESHGEQCGVCRRWKFPYVVRGPFPPLRGDPSSPVAKTREYFGSGAAADHEVIVSNDIYRELAKRKVKGVRFTVVQNRG